MIQIVRECEKNAADIVKKANAEAEGLILDAELKGKRMVEEAIERGAAEYARAKEQADERARALLLEESEKTARAAAELRSKAQKNIDAAVQFILKGIGTPWQ